MKKDSFLPGTKILEEVKSPINGKITVLKSLGLGTYIQIENLTQSGGVVYDVWKSALRAVHRTKNKVYRCLILGLGGGSAAILVRKHWPKARITGVDIDPIMVDLGRKYLGLDRVQVQVKVQDAFEFCSNQALAFNRHDLILVDTYLGHNYPKKFESEKFLRLIVRLLTSNGVAVFNRLYWDEKRALAVKFSNRLENIFPRVEVFYPEANMMIICSN